VDDGGSLRWLVFPMLQAEMTTERTSRRRRQNGTPASGGAVYGLGMIGAMVYFLRSAVSTRDYLLAIPRAGV
jgi:hypothetical protein